MSDNVKASAACRLAVDDLGQAMDALTRIEAGRAVDVNRSFARNCVDAAIDRCYEAIRALEEELK